MQYILLILSVYPEMMNLVAEISASISAEAFANARNEAEKYNRGHRDEAAAEPTEQEAAPQQQPPPQIVTSQPLPLITAKRDSDSAYHLTSEG